MCYGDIAGSSPDIQVFTQMNLAAQLSLEEECMSFSVKFQLFCANQQFDTSKLQLSVSCHLGKKCICSLAMPGP